MRILVLQRGAFDNCLKFPTQVLMMLREVAGDPRIGEEPGNVAGREDELKHFVSVGLLDGLQITLKDLHLLLHLRDLLRR